MRISGCSGIERHHHPAAATDWDRNMAAAAHSSADWADYIAAAAHTAAGSNSREPESDFR
jgi:hypothetical protein